MSLEKSRAVALFADTLDHRGRAIRTGLAIAYNMKAETMTVDIVFKYISNEIQVEEKGIPVIYF